MPGMSQVCCIGYIVSTAAVAGPISGDWTPVGPQHSPSARDTEGLIHHMEAVVGPDTGDLVTQSG